MSKRASVRFAHSIYTYMWDVIWDAFAFSSACTRASAISSHVFPENYVSKHTRYYSTRPSPMRAYARACMFKTLGREEACYYFYIALFIQSRLGEKMLARDTYVCLV